MGRHVAALKAVDLVPEVVCPFMNFFVERAKKNEPLHHDAVQASVALQSRLRKISQMILAPATELLKELL